MSVAKREVCYYLKSKLFDIWSTKIWKTCISVMAQQINLSDGTSQLILNKCLYYYTCNLQCSHELLSVQYPRQMEFCKWLQITFQMRLALIVLDTRIHRIWDRGQRKILICFAEKALHPHKLGVLVGIYEEDWWLLFLWWHTYCCTILGSFHKMLQLYTRPEKHLIIFKNCLMRE